MHAAWHLIVSRQWRESSRPGFSTCSYTHIQLEPDHRSCVWALLYMQLVALGHSCGAHAHIMAHTGSDTWPSSLTRQGEWKSKHPYAITLCMHAGSVLNSSEESSTPAAWSLCMGRCGNARCLLRMFRTYLRLRSWPRASRNAVPSKSAMQCMLLNGGIVDQRSIT